MVEAYARLITQRSAAWATVILTLVVAVASFVLSGQVKQDDDVLAFLPKTNPDIQAFYRINDRFGATDVALVGIEAGDVFEADFLTRLGELSVSLRDTAGLDHSLSIFNVPDFVKDPASGGIVSSTLVDAVPEDAAGMEALRAKVMSRDHIVGTLISEDASSVLVIGFAAPGAEHRDVAARLREAVLEHFDEDQLYWGGAPFISTWIYETTQDDMARLTPWSIAAIIVIMMLAFRDVLGTALGLLSTGIGIAMSRALMAVLDVSFNIVLSSMPVILFAVGSAYAIHMLSRYDAHAKALGRGPEAVAATIVQTGPTVFAAGMTTVVGLLSFIMMDIEPMRIFGLFTAIGIFVTLILSLTFVPAVMALFPRPVRTAAEGPLKPLTIGLARAARDRRGVAMAALAVVALAGASLAGQVDTRMDLGAFFEKGSPPDRAQRFLDAQFGGSQFIQVLIEGDLEQPEVLREIGRVADQITMIEHVSDVAGVHVALEITADAMTGARRVPDHARQIGVLYRFLASDPSVARIVTDERDAALLQVKVGSASADDLDAVLAEIEEMVRDDVVTSYAVVTRDEAPEAVSERVSSLVTARISALAVQYGVAMPVDGPERIAAFLSEAPPAASTGAVAEVVEAFLLSEESFVPLEPAQARAVAAAVAEEGDGADYDAIGQACAAALDVELDAPDVMDLQVVLEMPLIDFWRAERARAGALALIERLEVAVPEGAPGERFVAALASKLQDRDNPSALVRDTASETALQWTVNGMPVLYRGLSRSVTANQFRSLAFALVLVFAIMTLLFRSPLSGLLATAPTALTLTLIYGGMGWMGVHLDIGTSMLASIIIGAGVDYAVHLMAAWEIRDGQGAVDAAAHAVAETSHAIWTNAVMVAAGFFVLTLGDAKPLQNVGGLTSAAMMTAAVCTFLVIPMFASKTRYGRKHSITT